MAGRSRECRKRIANRRSHAPARGSSLLARLTNAENVDGSPPRRRGCVNPKKSLERSDARRVRLRRHEFRCSHVPRIFCRRFSVLGQSLDHLPPKPARSRITLARTPPQSLHLARAVSGRRMVLPSEGHLQAGQRTAAARQSSQLTIWSSLEDTHSSPIWVPQGFASASKWRGVKMTFSQGLLRESVTSLRADSSWMPFVDSLLGDWALAIHERQRCQKK